MVASIVGAVALVAGIITLLGANEAMLVTLVAAAITLRDHAVGDVHGPARDRPGTPVTEEHDLGALDNAG